MKACKRGPYDSVSSRKEQHLELKWSEKQQGNSAEQAFPHQTTGGSALPQVVRGKIRFKVLLTMSKA